jgi:hypothetical protein
MKKLNAVKFGLALGISFALYFFLLVLMAMYFNWGNAIVELLGSFYIGVDVSWTGALLAIPWTFVDFFIGGFIIAWIYNMLNK